MNTLPAEIIINEICKDLKLYEILNITLVNKFFLKSFNRHKYIKNFLMQFINLDTYIYHRSHKFIYTHNFNHFEEITNDEIITQFFNLIRENFDTDIIKATYLQKYIDFWMALDFEQPYQLKNLCCGCGHMMGTFIPIKVQCSQYLTKCKRCLKLRLYF